ncbi:hypothetical protein KC717_01095 [Candidatus Dojkabacteria bacterium]|uniref:Uncharacterized protein n=1 Tax=Candidatus Dojkabacteria bacterium TaxID=2099670 RepID=A0A955RJY9_9BACT|nr:hypothetical protein [Candidatus Dojkabacteria bacterium]
MTITSQTPNKAKEQVEEYRLTIQKLASEGSSEKLQEYANEYVQKYSLLITHKAESLATNKYPSQVTKGGTNSDEFSKQQGKHTAPELHKIIIDIEYLSKIIALSKHKSSLETFLAIREIVRHVFDITDKKAILRAFLQSQTPDDSLKLINHLIKENKLDTATNALVYLLFKGVNPEKLTKYNITYRDFLKKHSIDTKIDSLNTFKFEKGLNPGKVGPWSQSIGLIPKVRQNEIITEVPLNKELTTPEIKLTLQQKSAPNHTNVLFESSLTTSNGWAEEYVGEYSLDIPIENVITTIFKKAKPDIAIPEKIKCITANNALYELLSPAIYGTVYARGADFALGRARVINFIEEIIEYNNQSTFEKTIREDLVFFNTGEYDWFDEHSIDRIAMIICNRRTQKYWFILFQDVD